MQRAFFSLAGAMVGACVFAAGAEGAPTPDAPQSFQGKVYQVDTIYNNVDVIMPDRKRTLWADAATQVRVHGHRAQLIDIAMGDAVRGTYRSGPHGALSLVSIEDLSR
jgi:hypothetical protein